MTDLTDRWKKGELPNGMYYIEFKDGDIAKDVYAFGSWGNINEHFLGQVLAPVPSYEEWQEYKDANDSMFDTIKMLNKDNYKLEKENAQLKELLKRCYAYMLCEFGGQVDQRHLLMKEIEEVLK